MIPAAAPLLLIPLPPVVLEAARRDDADAEAPLLFPVLDVSIAVDEPDACVEDETVVKLPDWFVAVEDFAFAVAVLLFCV